VSAIKLINNVGARLCTILDFAFKHLYIYIYIYIYLFIYLFIFFPHQNFQSIFHCLSVNLP
ncbi:MAG: hypothetical protein N7Q72_05900, partial [Spiroplasma sp. Tabriz.8]|nr:hypothetical protein [Spiroplasma sp. Tabriz.8]